jgi:hypothetical protein
MGVLKIVRGRQHTALKVVLYGTEGIGKTSLAAQFPAPLILDTEKGSNQLDVARAPITSWQQLMLAVRELTVQPQGFQTIVVDSLDWAERLCKEHVCKDHGKKSLEDWAYGKGFNLFADTFATLLAACDKLIDVGLHVVLVSHSKVVKVNPPDQSEGYDRYELDLDKRNAPGAKEWADLLLFLNFRTKVVQGDDGKARAIGGKERVMFAERCAAWDAKNRFGLPESMPMGVDGLRSLFASSEPPLHERMATFIAEAKDVKVLGKMGDKIDAYESDGQLTAGQASELRDAIDARDRAIQQMEAADAVA